MQYSVSVIVDIKSPFLGKSFDNVDPSNCEKYSFYDGRLKRLKWSAPVYTLTCSSSGVIPQCSRTALKALGV